MRKGVFYILLIIASTFASCSVGTDAIDEIEPNTTSTNCTEEFRTIGIQVMGGNLESYHTVRLSNMERINVNISFGYPNMQWYTVLDDNYVHLLNNSTETFKFVGIRDGEVVVEEIFEIRGDYCHVHKVNGINQVSL